MTRVLKSEHSTSSVRIERLDWADPGRDAPSAPTPDPELTRLEAEVARLSEALAAAKADALVNCAAAREDGRLEAEAEFRQRDEARLEILRTGVSQAIESAARSFADLERLALELANVALSGAFGDCAEYRAQTARAVERQIEVLGAHTVLRVEVSQSDFNDAAALATLAAGLKAGGLDITALSTIAPGCARIALTLGEVELDLPRYWSEVTALLAHLARVGHSEQPTIGPVV